MSPDPQPYLTPDDYLALERQAETRSEYFQGEMFAMAGGSPRHNAITINIGGELRHRLRSKDCMVYSSDQRVKIEEIDKYTYPDVTVVCGESRFEEAHPDVLLNPQVIFEVLSDSTEAYDRGAKFEHYQSLDTLAEYILVSQDAVRVEQFVRQDDNTWTYRELHSIDDVIRLETIGCELALEEIYLKVPPLETAR